MKKLNPVSKIRLIIDMMTYDGKIRNSLLTAISRELTVDQINKLYEQITIKNNQLKLKL